MPSLYIHTMTDLDERLAGWIDSYEKVKAEFLERLENDPRHALTWSAALFEESSRFMLATFWRQNIAHWRNDVEKGLPHPTEAAALEHIRLATIRNVMERARRIPRSSSPESNAVENYERAAHSALADLFGPLEDH